MKALVDKARDAARQMEDLARTGIDEARDKGEELLQRRQLDSLARQLGYVEHRIHGGEGGLQTERERLLLAMDGMYAALGDEDLVATVGLDTAE